MNGIFLRKIFSRSHLLRDSSVLNRYSNSNGLNESKENNQFTFFKAKVLKVNLNNVEKQNFQNTNILSKYYRAGNLNNNIISKCNISLKKSNESKNNNRLKLNFTCSNFFATLKTNSNNDQQKKNIPNLSLSLHEKASINLEKNSEISSINYPKLNKSSNKLIIKKIQINSIRLRKNSDLKNDIKLKKSGNSSKENLTNFLHKDSNKIYKKFINTVKNCSIQKSVDLSALLNFRENQDKTMPFTSNNKIMMKAIKEIQYSFIGKIEESILNKSITYFKEHFSKLCHDAHKYEDYVIQIKKLISHFSKSSKKIIHK